MPGYHAAAALLAALLAATLLAALPMVRAQVVCPNGGVDGDGDTICDSGWPEVCRCGVKDECNDNCVGSSNPLQLDFDCDGVGTGSFNANPPFIFTLRCDLCPYHHDPSNLDSDGDLIGDACDPDKHNATIPRFAPATRPRSRFLLIFFVCLGAALLIVALVIWVCIASGGMRTIDGDASAALHNGAAGGPSTAFGQQAALGLELAGRRYRPTVLH